MTRKVGVEQQPRLFELEDLSLVVGTVATLIDSTTDWTHADAVWALKNNPTKVSLYRKLAKLGFLDQEKLALLDAMDRGEGYKP